MKNVCISFVLIFTSFLQGKSQVLNKVGSINHRSLKIIIFNNQESICTENEFIDPSRIENGEILPDSSSKEICKLMHINSIIIYKLKPDTKLMTLNDVFNFYKIKPSIRGLAIKVDDKVLNHPETILISQNQISSVNVKTGRSIDIILKGYIEVWKKFKGAPFRSKQ